MATLITPVSVHRETKAQEDKGQSKGHIDGQGQSQVAPSLNLWLEELLDHLSDCPGERLRWEFSAQPFQGDFPAQNHRVREAFQAQGQGQGRGSRWEGALGVSPLTSAQWRQPGRPGAGGQPERRGWR